MQYLILLPILPALWTLSLENPVWFRLGTILPIFVYGMSFNLKKTYLYIITILIKWSPGKFLRAIPVMSIPRSAGIRARVKTFPTRVAMMTRTIRRKWVPFGGTAIMPNMAMLKMMKLNCTLSLVELLHNLKIRVKQKVGKLVKMEISLSDLFWEVIAMKTNSVITAC